MKYVKKLAFCIAAVLITVLAAGCSKNYTCADIAGTWTNHVLDIDQEWTFTADGKYTETSVADAGIMSFGSEDSGKFHFEGDMIFFESDDGEWGNNGSFKVQIVDGSTMLWTTDAGKIREFKKK